MSRGSNQLSETHELQLSVQVNVLIVGGSHSFVIVVLVLVNLFRRPRCPFVRSNNIQSAKVIFLGLFLLIQSQFKNLFRGLGV